MNLCSVIYNNTGLTPSTEANPVDTLQKQFAGYGSTHATVARFMDKLALKEPLEDWSNETVELVVNAFIDEKFPTVFALNKIDHPDADKVRGIWLVPHILC